jgi:uncharacterized membrane protein YhaH (DUF805 family)
MFKDPFSFKGRIRRKEYVLTMLILYIGSLILGFAIGDGIEGIYLWLFLILLAAFVWIQLAQNTKRCHDVNTSGWFQLIPFYTLYLLFAEGDKFKNQYGPSPKYKDEEYGQFAE